MMHAPPPANHAQRPRPPCSGWTSRTALILFATIVLYFASYFPAFSIALRTRQTWPSAWTFYRPIPFQWQDRMLRFWRQVDPRVKAEVTRICPLT